MTYARASRFFAPYGESCSDKISSAGEIIRVSKYKAIVESVGAEFVGIQYGPEGSLVLFADPQFRSTLAVPEESFSVERIARRIQESRAQFLACR